MTKEDRAWYQDDLFYQMAQYMRRDEYEDAIGKISALTDDQFESMRNQMLAETEQCGSFKEYKERLQEIREKHGVTPENSALNARMVVFLDDKRNRDLWTNIDATSPSDCVCLKEEDRRQLLRLWNPVNPETGCIKLKVPSDLLFAGSIALTDIDISMDGLNLRVVIFPDYAERIAEGDDETMIGALIIRHDGAQLANPMFVMKGLDEILFTEDVGHRNLPDDLLKTMKMPQSVFQDAVIHCAMNWYGIQIALLHPVVKDVFHKGGRQKEKETVTDAKGNRKRIVRYVRRRIVNSDELARAITGNGKSRTYHALVWHVIGHWRLLPSGRKTFVRPYWKGALRSIKRNLDDVERQLVLPEEE